MISKHFDESEAVCRCGCGQLIRNSVLIGVLEAIRAKAGERYGKELPVYVYSWHRCPAHNTEVGGVQNSYHCQGMAADITIDGVDLDELAEIAGFVGADGIGIYRGQGFVHVDVRGYAARWEE